MNTTRTFTRIGMVVAAGTLWAALIPGAALATTDDAPAENARATAAATAVKATGAGSDAAVEAADAAQDAAESTWAFGFVFDSEDTGIGIIYYTAPYFDLDDIVNPATGEPYTAVEIEAILAGANAEDAADQGYITAPKDALLGLAVYDGDETYWYDAETAMAIIEYGAPLTLDTATGELVDADGAVVAQPMVIEGVTYADGTYEGAGKGMGGEVPVTVTVEDGKIVSVEVGKNAETEGIGSKAIEQLPALIVEANGIDGIDVVSGASITSKAIFDAIDQALADAVVEEPAAPTDDAVTDATANKDGSASDKTTADTAADKDGAKPDTGKNGKPADKDVDKK